MIGTEELDLQEKGIPRNGIPQSSNRRLFIQLQVYGNCSDAQKLVSTVQRLNLPAVLYQDFNDPRGVGLLCFAEDPAALSSTRDVLLKEPFVSLQQKLDMNMIGRTYSSGREQDLEDWLLEKPKRVALNPTYLWHVWYPLRRKPEFERLPSQEKGKILGEHALLGMKYGTADFAHDIRLACHGLDAHDNDFVIGLIGKELFPLSRLVQDMRKSEQTAKYVQSLGPFFVGHVLWQSPYNS